jgi:NhaP-type Na+/H+ or K+/H+ antiporter
VSLTILLSIVVHGASASFVMARLDRRNGRHESVG